MYRKRLSDGLTNGGDTNERIQFGPRPRVLARVTPAWRAPWPPPPPSLDWQRRLIKTAPRPHRQRAAFPGSLGGAALSEPPTELCNGKISGALAD
jgi:hypothetical protein